jgi:hypothetical protein
MVYTVAGNGTALSIHFCMGDYSGISLDHEESPICGKCGMDDKEGCCHDQLQIIKFDSQASKTASFDTGSFQNVFHAGNDFNFEGIFDFNRFNVPPLVLPVHYAGPPLHLLNCNFRI